MGSLELCFSLLSVQSPGGGGVPRTVFQIVTVQWSSGVPAPLATGPDDQEVTPV